jgi:hypothetical protein
MRILVLNKYLIRERLEVMSSISSCPACGGQKREFFECSGDAGIRIKVGFLDFLTLSALICLDCGHTEIRPTPANLAYLRRQVERK